MSKHKKVLWFSLILILLAGTAFVMGRFCFTQPAVPSAEANYKFKLADSNNDNSLSAEELQAFKEMQKQLSESKGQLKVSVESHRLYDAKEDEMSEPEREDFMKRTQLKDAAVE